MDLHRVRRLSWALVASQIRSAGRTADPKSWTGQPGIFGWADLGIFAGVFGLAAYVLYNSALPRSVLLPLVNTALPFLPLLAVAAVLFGGVMFELTGTAKFAGSDAANWLPLSPREYVLASSSAVAYTYSPAIALFLGGFSAVAVYVGAGAPMLLAGALTVLGLFEGALMVEMVRSVSQRAGAAASHRGRLSLVVRAVAVVVFIVALQLAFNPVFLYDSLQGLASFGELTAFLPPFWGTFSLLRDLAGDPLLGAVFALAEVAFAASLFSAATALRVRYWSVSAEEFHLGPHEYAAAHPILRRIGLSGAEAAIVTKDFHGYFRRREMLPMLVLPVVLLIVVFLEDRTSGSGIGTLGAVIFAGWAASFFALLLGSTSVGQERKAVWTLYAAPLTPGAVFRAKLVAAVLPAWVASAVVAVLVGVLFHVGTYAVIGLALTAAVAGLAVALWGLVFAARYSDFQERPRPQYLRSGAMLAATGSGVVIVFAIVIPGSAVFLSSGALAWEGGVVAAGVAITVITLGWHWARAGFERLLAEIQF